VGCFRAGAWSERSLEAVEVAGQVATIALRNPKIRHQLSTQVRRRSGAEADDAHIPPIFCQSSAMQEVLQVAARVRESAVPVLITGETGSGKEIMARYLHEAAARRQHPFVPVLCAAVPETFQSREMFGIEKGAAPGVEGRGGRFEECGAGTLYLDEIGSMSLSLQAKLLRVLEERRFSRVGSGSSQYFAGRVVASTSTDLNAAMETGSFLPELYHRLALIELRVPPLRERLEDIPALAQHFAEQFCVEQKLPLHRLAPQLLGRLTTHAWPGNVRELKNAVERSLLLSDGAEITFAGRQDSPPPSEFSMTHLLEQAMEKQWSVPELQLKYSHYVYEQVGRNKAHACRILRINYRTLCNYLESATPAPSPDAPSVH
jgi:DNA-binding NtrC family response regulator